MSESITIETYINAPIEKVWSDFTEPEAIVIWNTADADWHTTAATNDLKVGGKFSSRMEAKDGSSGFDFEGVYDEVIPNQKISYSMSDGRKVSVMFMADTNGVRMVETFDPESENTLEMQKAGWQAILDNFKKYVENS
jgi:uncharacterized protein YndB with AHSA1/START domain